MPKKKSVKKKPVKKNVCGDSKCHCNIGLLKLSSMAFILFLVIVWPRVGSALLRPHWGWYLGIFVVLGLGALSTHKNCMCHKK